VALRSRRSQGIVALAAAASLALAGAANAQPAADGGSTAADTARDAHQHGTAEGHLFPAGTSANVQLVSRLGLKNVVPEKIADVGVWNGYAFLAAWGGTTCSYNGIHVVDIREVSQPREVAFIQAKEGSAPGEGVQGLHLDTPSFTGDVLVTNNEKCKDQAGFGGMNIYDITDPAHPTPLAEGVGDETVSGQGKKAAHEIHSVFAWDAGDKAYAVIVDNEEEADVDILDITDPKKARLIAEYDLDQTFPQILQAAPDNLTQVFFHDVVVKQVGGRFHMLASYWDAGYVVLDVTDPLHIAYVGDTDFTDPDPQLLEAAGRSEHPEGNGHEAEWTLDNRYVIGADEDFTPIPAEASTDDAPAAVRLSQGSDTPKLGDGQTLTGTAVYAGRACSGDAAVPPAPVSPGNQIAVVARGLCTFTEKVANVERAGGYEGVVIVNREGGDACGLFGMTVSGNTPTFSADRRTGFGFFDREADFDQAACLAGTASEIPGVALGQTGDVITIRGFFDGWGYVHLFRNEAGKMYELDTWAIPQGEDPAYATGFGALSVHEVATSQRRADLAYYSYYSGGFRVTKIVNDRLVEVGHFIDQGGNNFWGVQVFQQGGQEYVAASDRDLGLYIFRYTGAE